MILFILFQSALYTLTSLGSFPLSFLSHDCHHVAIGPSKDSNTTKCSGVQPFTLLARASFLLQATSPTDLYVQWMKQGPDASFIRYLGAFNQGVLVVNNPTANKYLLQASCYAFAEPKWLQGLASEIGDVLINGTRQGFDHHHNQSFPSSRESVLVRRIALAALEAAVRGTLGIQH